MEKTKIGIAAIIMLLLVMFGIASTMSYNDELQALKIYCESVEDGIWPDYKEIYDKECRNGMKFK